MKYLLVFALCLTSVNCNAFFYQEEDKKLHYGVSLASTILLTDIIYKHSNRSATESYLAAFTIVMTLGIFKETFHDETFDQKDIHANVFGGLSAVPILYFTF